MTPQQTVNDAWDLFKVALETGVKQPGMDAEYQDCKAADSEGVLVVADLLKLTIKLCKRDGKLLYRYNTLSSDLAFDASEIAIDVRDDREFVFIDSSGISGDAMQTADRLLRKLGRAVPDCSRPVRQRRNTLTTELITEEPERYKISREEQKAQRERAIFRQFVAAARLEVEDESISSERPQRPDISCCISGTKHYFELREVTDQNLAARVGTSTVTAGSFSPDRPLIDAFSDKAKKNYGNLDGPLELLVYYDKQYPPREGSLEESTRSELEIIVKDMLAGSWARIWLYDTWKGVILGVWKCGLVTAYLMLFARV